MMLNEVVRNVREIYKIITWASAVSQSESTKPVGFKPELHDNIALQGGLI